MLGRTFIIQRYCRDNWPMLMGRFPMITSGPNFTSWASQGEREHKLRPSIKRILSASFPSPQGEHMRRYQLRAIAEVMLTEKVLDALWVTEPPMGTPREQDRWQLSLSEIEKELWDPGYVSVESEVSYYLSGIRSPEMARSYVSEDGLKLESIFSLEKR